MATKGKKITSTKKQTVTKKTDKNSALVKEKKALAEANRKKAELEKKNQQIRQLQINSEARKNVITQDILPEDVDLGKYGKTYITSHDDDGTSESLLGPKAKVAFSDTDDNNLPAIFSNNATKDIYHSSNLFTRNEINSSLYTKTFRFGLLNPYGAISTAREYLFFTKPDLNIMNTDENLIPSIYLQDGLCNLPFWADLLQSRVNTTIKSLQNSMNKTDPFNHLLQNMVASNLDIPGLSSEMTETPTNMYGVSFAYRGSSEASDDNPEFSLEFKDTKYLDVFTYFKAYEEYETLKHHGIIRPSKFYIKNKILHDQFSIYKFIVDEDMETIIYYGKMYGVVPKSLPREVFSNPTFDSGLTYSIDFRAAFYEDMKPDILADFNYLSKDIYNQQKYQITPHNSQLDHADMRPGVAAFVYKDTSSEAAKLSPTGYVYKLKWRGSDKI